MRDAPIQHASAGPMKIQKALIDSMSWNIKGPRCRMRFNECGGCGRM
jgi:hypothetical protein